MAELQHMSKQELTNLLTVARKNNTRDWLMMLVAYWHGIRATELVSLTDKDVQDGYIKVVRLKGSKTTTHNLIESKEDIFNEKKYLTEYVSNTKGRLFPVTRFGFYAIVRKYGKQAGIPKHRSHPHVLKHSIAQHLVDRVTLPKLQRYLGHANLNSTAAYTKATDIQACEAVHDALFKD